MCACYYAFLACLQCVAQQAGIRMLANYIRCCVVVTVIGVSFILITDLLACLRERKAKFLVQLMTVTQLQQSIISFFFCKCCSLHRNFVGSTLYLSHSGTHVCVFNHRQAIKYKDTLHHVSNIFYLHYTPYVW